jgi:hypothetical protein
LKLEVAGMHLNYKSHLQNLKELVLHLEQQVQIYLVVVRNLIIIMIKLTYQSLEMMTGAKNDKVKR